jgi:hypothetical protein
MSVPCEHHPPTNGCVKGHVHPRTGHEGPEGEQRYSSTLSLTSALDGVGGQRHALAALAPGKRTVPIVQEAGWAPGPVWTGTENLAPTGIRSPDLRARSESPSRPAIGLLRDEKPQGFKHAAIFRRVSKIAKNDY